MWYVRKSIFMIEKVKKDIERRISLIEGGDFSIDDVRLLFIDMRDSLPETDQPDPKISQLYDIFNFAAHPNSRERGKTFKVSERIVTEFTNAIKRGGSVNVHPVELAIVESLVVVLDILGVPYEKELLKSQEVKLERHIYFLLDGVDIGIKNDSIESAHIYCDSTNKYVFIEFRVKPFNNTIGNLTISGSPTMRFRLM